MTASLIKASEKDKKAIKLMAQNLNLLTSVTIKVIQTANTWQNKKVKKTGLCVNLFVKAAKLILKDKSANNEEVIKEGARLVTALQVSI